MSLKLDIQTETQAGSEFRNERDGYCPIRIEPPLKKVPATAAVIRPTSKVSAFPR
jgi:hypothetical protein